MQYYIPETNMGVISFALIATYITMDVGKKNANSRK